MSDFIRKGECNRCGECCSSGDPFLGRAGEPEIPGACVLLTLLPEGFHACKDRRHPVYLAGCNVWPSQPSHISEYPSCSYTFELVK